MKLIIGLGNPGDKYEKTRHNAGFLFVDYIQNEMFDLFSSWRRFKKLEADISGAKIGGEEINLVKPQTFMNDSGRAVKNIAIMYKLKDLHDLYIIHDDIDLEFGKYKIQKNRGSAGHNGVQSIINYLKTNNFTRTRIGIYPSVKPDKKLFDTAEYVLKNFTRDEILKLYSVVFPEITKDLKIII